MAGVAVLAMLLAPFAAAATPSTAPRTDAPRTDAPMTDCCPAALDDGEATAPHTAARPCHPDTGHAGPICAEAGDHGTMPHAPPCCQDAHCPAVFGAATLPDTAAFAAPPTARQLPSAVRVLAGIGVDPSLKPPRRTA